jgi:squalene-associated FAD-dependent desaturase
VSSVVSSIDQAQSPHAPTRASSPPRVVIVGGGLAGMAAAVALEAAGFGVTLLEARRALGGRAGSYEDPQTGETLDNCQHVLLGCCTNLKDFYRRVGVTDSIRYEREILFADSHGRRFGLSAVPTLPAPLHLGPSMLRFGALTWGERVASSQAMLAMLRLGAAGRAKLADVAFGGWLDEHRQPQSLVEKLYDPILVGALNEQTRRASAAYAIQVFQGALLANARGYVMGVPRVPLGELYGRLPCRDVRLGTRVSEIVFAGTDSVAGVRLASGEMLAADSVVLATNHHAVARWIPLDVAARDARFAHLEEFESVPILGAHMRFDRPVLPGQTHAAFLSGPLQWLFRKDDSGRVVHGVISAARDWVNVEKQSCLDRFFEQIRSTFGAAKDAKLQWGTIVVEKRATFSPRPGIDRIRPSQSPPETGGVQNLFLAGDYTLTGWPATMEGAVRSGYLAAEAIVDRALTGAGSPPPRFVVDDLPIQWPARWLGMGKRT